MGLPSSRIRRGALPFLLMITSVLAGVLSLRPASASADVTPAKPTASIPCGVRPRQDAPAKYAHVIWILMENKSYSQVAGSPDAPYINKLGSECGVATNYFAISHPSLPNYIALTSGGLQGVADDNGPSAHPLSVPSIFSQLQGDWRGLDETMSTNCEQKNDGPYAVRHNPAAYYTNIRTICNVKDIPLSADSNLSADLSARFTFVTPNVCDDMHNNCLGTGTAGELQSGDAFLAGFVPKLINSTEYQAGDTAIFITWDEGGGSNQVLTEVIAPTVTPGTQSGTLFTHYSLLRTTEELLGLPYIGQAATAHSMRDAFGL